ncbi:hypothetical protein COP2_003742 [Malus domestica]
MEGGEVEPKEVKMKHAKTDRILVSNSKWERRQHWRSGTRLLILPRCKPLKNFTSSQILHGRIPQLAVIGFSESISNLYTSKMRCRWLAELLGGTFKLPCTKEMEKHVEKWDTYAKRHASSQYYQRSCIGVLHLWYKDQLYKDMGWNPKRKYSLLNCLSLMAPWIMLPLKMVNSDIIKDQFSSCFSNFPCILVHKSSC